MSLRVRKRECHGRLVRAGNPDRNDVTLTYIVWIAGRLFLKWDR